LKTVIPGRASREPGIQLAEPGNKDWIPGSPLRGAPE
jgi:hypothetical protein